MDDKRFKKRTIFLIAYLVFALLPIYWMVNMSFKTNQEILSASASSRSISPGRTTGPSSPTRPGTRAISTA